MMKIYTLITALTLVLTACTPIDEEHTFAVPTDLSAEQTGLAKIKLTWTMSGTSYDGVMVDRMLVGVDETYTLLAELKKDVLIFNDTSMPEEGTYRYRVTSFLADRTGESAEITVLYAKLPAPTDLRCDMTDAGLVIAWKDNCVGEEGYVLRRKQGTSDFKDWKVLGPNTETVTDENVTSGVYEYEIWAFAGSEKSSAATVRFENLGTPVLTVGELSSSWHQVYVPMTLVDDGGYQCKAGICWKADGSAGATVEDMVYEYQVSVASGDKCFGSAVGLEYGKTYSFRPWVRYNGNVEYYAEVTGKLSDEPQPYKPEWTDISADYSMPASIRLYKTSTTVTGRTVNAWYAIADMSAGDLELRTFKTASVTQPSVAAGTLEGEVQIMVNGGYFGGKQSYSYVMNRGTEEAAGVKSVTRSFYDANRKDVSKSYNITRGAFGVNQKQEPSVKWLYGSYMWAYDSPLPTYNSGPVLTPSSTYPAEKQTWDVYSAIGGGPVLLKDGDLCFDYLITKDKGNGGRYAANYELLGDDIFGPSVRPPRTAIGCTEDGKIVIMVVDGRNSGGSAGTSLDELALLMKGVGCVDVLNLDGGGSSVICVTPDAQILNVPSDGKEREVLSFVALVKK